MFGMHTLVQTQRQWEHLSGPNKGIRTKGAMTLARTPAFVFMAKRGITNSQAFKEELQSDHALSLRMIVDERSN